MSQTISESASAVPVPSLAGSPAPRAQDSAVALRDRTVAEHYPLVRVIARRLAARLPGFVDVDELVAMGVIGLLDAIERFDPSRGVPFRAYAEIRIRGAVMDGLRAADWAPRTVRRGGAQIEDAVARFRNRHGRDPSPAEVAAQLGMAPERYTAFRSASQALRTVSLDEPLADDCDARLSDQLEAPGESASEACLRAEREQALDAAIERLPERERIVVTALYREGKTLREIGEVMGVTESRACQLHGQAIRRLRRIMGGEE